MSKRGSRNAEFLSRNFFDSNNEVQREKKKPPTEMRKTVSKKLDSNEILSTTQPLRGKRKPISKTIPFNNKLRRPRETSIEFVSNQEPTRKIYQEKGKKTADIKSPAWGANEVTLENGTREHFSYIVKEGGELNKQKRKNGFRSQKNFHPKPSFDRKERRTAIKIKKNQNKLYEQL